MEYSEFSQKKWKYLSFALLAIIASGILAPTALAASPTLTDIFNKLGVVDAKVTATQTSVNNILSNVTAIKSTTNTNLDAKISSRATQTSVNNVQGNVTLIKSKTDALPSDPASQAVTGSVKTIRFEHSFNPTADIRVQESIRLIPPSSGKTFSGHISMSTDADSFGNTITLECILGPSGVDRPIEQATGRNFDADFTCNSLVLTVVDPEPESGFIVVSGLAQYVESTNITDVS